MKLPDWMKWIEGEKRFAYLSREDSASLKAALESGNQQVASLLVRIAQQCYSAHCACKY